MQQFLQLHASLLHSLRIRRINHIDQSISVGKVVAPVLTQSFLSSDIPDIQFKFIMS